MQVRFRFQSLRSKLLLAVFTLVLGSGLLISYLVTNRYSENLLDAMVAQGEYLSHSLALEATDKILTNDVVALQKLLTSHLESNLNIAYLFVVRDDRIIAHTFSKGFPTELINANKQRNKQSGSYHLLPPAVIISWISPGRFFPERPAFCVSDFQRNLFELKS